MATTGYTSAGGYFITGYGTCRLHGDIVYYPTRSNNTISFTNTYGRLKHVRESGTWTSYYYAAGWTSILQIPAGTTRKTQGWSGTRVPNNVDTQGSVSFSIGVSAVTTSTTARIYGYYAGDSASYASKTLSFPAAGYPTINTDSVDNIETDQARVVWTSSNGSYCTFSSMKIDYGLTLSYGSTKSGLSADSNTTLTGLKAGKEYFYKLTITNGAGRTGTGTGSFTTKRKKNGLLLLLS